MKRTGPALVLMALALSGVALAALAHDTPIAPPRAREWLRADALSALALILLGAHGLVACGIRQRGLWPTAVAACLFGAAALTGHMALIGILLVLGGAVVALGTAARAPLVATLCAGLGLAAIGAAGGEWRYGAPAAGAGLSSLSFALLLAGAMLAAGAHGLGLGRAPEGWPSAAVACLYTLMRLYSLGPWNLGWLFAALVAGGATALWAGWQAAAAPPAQIERWLGLYLCALALAGAGLGSGAGVAMAGYALLTWPALRLGLALPGGPRWARWLLTGAVPLTAPFMAAWMAVAAAVAGGLTLLAAALWAAALLAAVGAARLTDAFAPALAGAGPAEPAPALAGAGPAEPALVAATLSVALGVGAPLAVVGLLGPVVAQLQGGLTPFGEIALWPWAGLIALDTARQPVATLPSLAMAALMMILAALCWVALRLARRGRG